MGRCLKTLPGRAVTWGVSRGGVLGGVLEDTARKGGATGRCHGAVPRAGTWGWHDGLGLWRAGLGRLAHGRAEADPRPIDQASPRRVAQDVLDLVGEVLRVPHEVVVGLLLPELALALRLEQLAAPLAGEALP